MNCSARPPLSDFKSYHELYSHKLILGTVSSAALLTYAPVLNEYNALVAAGGDIEDFEWTAHMERYHQHLIPNFERLFSIQVVKKFLQYKLVNSLESIVADRFIKDILKSAARKFNRYGRSLTLLTETFTMAVRADVLYRLAILTVDSVGELRNWFMSKRREFNILFAGRWLLKRALRLVLGSAMGAIGFAIGSFVDQKFMILGGLCASLSEIAMTPIFDTWLAD